MEICLPGLALEGDLVEHTELFFPTVVLLRLSSTMLKNHGSLTRGPSGCVMRPTATFIFCVYCKYYTI